MLPLAGWFAASVSGAPPAYDRIEAGDLAWARGDRPSARSAWHDAAKSPHPATVAMAEARLLQVSGNPGLAIHGPRMEAALARCPASLPWCALARHDARFFQSRLLSGPLPEQLVPSTDPDLVAAHAVRATWSNDTPRAVPTWTIGIGPYGASGLGFGAALQLRHPDLWLKGGHLSLQAGATTSSDHILAATIDTPGTLGVHAEVNQQQLQLESPRTSVWQAHTITLGPRATVGRQQGWLGGTGWADRVGEQRTRALGLSGRGAHPLSQTLRLGWSLTSMWGDLRLQSASVDLARDPGPRGLALHGVVTATSAEDTPAWRQPGWGGGTVLRHGRFLQYQAPVLSAGIAEWRQPLSRAWSSVVFVESAHTSELVAGVGTGVRLSLPPRPSANLRVDAAWGGPVSGPGALGISVGWGEAF